MLWSYGERSNDDFFLYHGFVVPDNDEDDFILFQDLSHLVTWWQDLAGGQHQGSAVRKNLMHGAGVAAEQLFALAGSRCPSPHLPGTCSTLMVPLKTAAASLEDPNRLPHQVQVERRLASLRLHRNEWGTSTCPTAPIELKVTAGGLVDVRLLGALMGLQQLRQGNPNSWAQVLLERCRQCLADFGSATEYGHKSGMSPLLDDLDQLVDQFMGGKRRTLQCVVQVCEQLLADPGVARVP